MQLNINKHFMLGNKRKKNGETELYTNIKVVQIANSYKRANLPHVSHSAITLLPMAVSRNWLLSNRYFSVNHRSQAAPLSR